MTESPRYYSVQRLIEDSIREGRIIHIPEQIRDTQPCLDWISALEDAADDWGHGASCRSYWGEDVDGDAWEICLHFADAD